MFEDNTALAGVIGLLVGLLSMRILVSMEIKALKDELQAADEENDKLIAENKRLREHNCQLFDRLQDGKQNIPDYGKW